MNFCSREGWVVDGRAMPTDPIDHDAARLPALGCTNIRCSLCNEKVRSIPNKQLANIHANADVRELFEAADPAQSPLVVDSPWRLYVCRCAFHHEVGEHPLDDLDGGVQVATQWSCAGHPVAMLPHTFDGVIVAPTNLEALVAQALAGTIPPGAHLLDRDEANWIARLCVRLDSTPHAQAIAAAVAGYLADPDLMTRTRAVRFFTTLGRYMELMNLDRLLGVDAALFVGVADAFADSRREPTLEHAIWRLAGGEVARNATLRDIARAAAKDPVRATYVVFHALAKGDLTWFSDHAEELARLHPTRIKNLTDAARDHKAIADRIRAAAPS